MGFFDSLMQGIQQGAEKQQEKNQRMQEQIQYREAKKRAHIAEIENLSDSALLRKVRDSYLSNEDRAIVERTLRNRGYYQDSYGRYNK